MDKSIRIVLTLAAWSQVTTGRSCGETGELAYGSQDFHSFEHHYPHRWHSRDIPTHVDFSEDENEDNIDGKKDKDYWNIHHPIDWNTDRWSGNKGKSDWNNQGAPNTWNLNKPKWNNQDGGLNQGTNNWNNQGNGWDRQDNNNNGWNNQGVPDNWNNQGQPNSNWNQGGSNGWNNWNNNQNRPNSWNNQNRPNSWNNPNNPNSWNNQGGGNNWNNGNNPNRPNSWNNQGVNNWNNQFDTGNGNNQGRPTRVPQTSTPASQTPMPLETAQCIRNCPVTSEYNPVCGTDNVTYGNIGRLECAKFCGVEVTVQRSSPCPTNGNQNTQNPVTSNPNKDVDTTRFPNVVTQPTSRPDSNVDFTISPDILNSIFTTTEADDNVDIDIRTKSKVQPEIVYPPES